MTDKFWLINDLQHWLSKSGMQDSAVDVVTFCTATVLLFILLRIVDYGGSKLIIWVLHNVVKKSRTHWNDALADHHFFKRAIRFIFTLVLIYLIEIVFKGYSANVVKGALIAVKCLAVFFIIDMLNAVINTVHDIYNNLPRSKERSIKGYVQSAKIILYIIGVLIAVSIIADIKLSKVLLGLATSAAILTLVFKDTILGFTASIQLSAQDMIRLGDWIQMDSQSANGFVIDMSVTTVKVQNWDNTYTMLPIYSMVNSAFINWRGMYDSAGRQFIRPFLVDIRSVRYLGKDEWEKLKDHPIVTPLYDAMMEDATLSTPELTTNLSLYRSWIHAFLTGSELINHDIMLLIRYLPMNENGLPIQVYGYTLEKRFVQYEEVVSHITEKIVAGAGPFGIRLYQRFTDTAYPETPGFPGKAPDTAPTPDNGTKTSAPAAPDPGTPVQGGSV